MNAGHIAAALGNARATGDGWMAKCPSHPDTRASLSLRDCGDGKVLVHCFAGCSQDAVIAALKRRGLWPKPHVEAPYGGGSTNPPDTAATAQRSGCTLAGYAEAKKLPVDFLRALGITEVSLNGATALRMPYRDAAGKEIAVRFRIALDGSDKFRWRKGNRPTLYGIDRLKDARSDDFVFLVEGESDAQTLWHANLPAVGIPGANTWREERDAPLLDGIKAILVVLEPNKGGEAVMSWLVRSKIRDRAYIVRLAGFKDISALYCDNSANFLERLNAALENAGSLADQIQTESRVKRASAFERCNELARAPDILTRFADELAARGVVGEERAAKLIYLAATSRLLDRPVSVAVKGPSSGGKSFVTERVLKFFPDDAYYVETAMSEHALAYSTEPLRHRMFVLYEAAGLGEFATYLMRSLLSEGRIRYKTVERTKDGLRPRLIEREGPTGLIVTTTAAQLHAENETRMLSVTVTDTPDQTAAVLRALAEQRGVVSRDLERWHELQNWVALGPTAVVIPFANGLAELVPPVAVRLRRDFAMILTLIKAHALLHQATREIRGDTIVASLDDYAAVRALIFELVAEGIEATVPPRVRRLVEALDELPGGRGGVDPRDPGVSLFRLAEKLGLDKASVSRRAKEAIARSYVRNLEDKRGRPARLVLGDPMPSELEILPSRESLAVTGRGFHGPGE